MPNAYNGLNQIDTNINGIFKRKEQCDAFAIALNHLVKIIFMTFQKGQIKTRWVFVGFSYEMITQARRT